MVADSTPRTNHAPAGALALPRAFGNYLLFDRIGRGGMAEIFLARMTTDLGVSRRVVVKEILPELSSDPGFARMLVSEAKLSAKLSHRNIVRVLDLGRESGRLFIAMEYVEGYDLNQLLRELSRRRLPFPAEFALFVVREVLAALGYAHRAGDGTGAPLAVVHRDVSPSNVLISFEGEVSLCDFGIARALSYELDSEPRDAARPAGSDADESRVKRARVAGKSAYMAPEHARGEELDARSDLFAAGILLWELCAGRRLYRGTEHEMLEMARRGVVQPLPERGLYDQARLQGILDCALSVDPATRYQSATKMLEDLDDYALAAQLMASQLRFATFLTDNFSEDIVALRLTREQAATTAMLHPPTQVSEPEPVMVPSEPPRTSLSEMRSVKDASGPRVAGGVAGVHASRRADDDELARNSSVPVGAPLVASSGARSVLFTTSLAVVATGAALALWFATH